MWNDIQEYETLRLGTGVPVGPGGGLRMGGTPGLIQSGPGRTIMLSVREGTTYTCFRIVETGHEFSPSKVDFAIPKGAAAADRLRKTAGPTPAPSKKVAPATSKSKKNVPRRIRSAEGEVVVQPKRRAGQTPRVFGPAKGVEESDG